MPVAEESADPAFIVRGNIDTARPAEDMTVLETGQANGRRVDDRHQFFDVVDHKPVEERFIAVLQTDEKNVPFDVGGFFAEIPEHPLNLLV
ncbi:MAG: hypothetical protein ACD_75C01072G0003 [uncultured bacterium]|nr:MAG: hypothetical protein ACD_75C01072G0003 [uncultured bacterium]